MQIQFKYLLICFIVLFSVSANSQDIVFAVGGNYATGVFKYGENSGGIDENYSGPGFHGGVSFEGVITGDRKEEFVFSVGLMGDYKMTKQDLTGDLQNEANLLYVNIPAYLMYRYKLRSKDKVYGGIGPYLGVGTTGTLMGDKVQWGSEAGTDHLKRIDYGVTAKIGYRGFSGIDISASYDYGIPDVITVFPSWSLKHRAIRLSIGYALNLND